MPNFQTTRASPNSRARKLPTGNGFRLFSQALLFCILGLAPLALGGRSDFGKLVYIALVGLYALTYLCEQTKREALPYWSTGVDWLVVAPIVLMVTAIPLGPDLVNQLSPGINRVLPLWQSTALGGWSTLSLTPHATRFAACVLFAHIALFITLCQRLRTLDDIESTLKTVGVATIWLAAFAMLQYASRSERFGFFLHPSRDASKQLSGPFANTNHFCHCMAMGIGVLIWWWHRTVPKVSRGATGNRFNSPLDEQPKREAHIFVMLGMGLVVVATLIAASRGGILVLLLSVCFCCLVLFAAKQIKWPMMAAFSAIAVLVGIGLWLHGYERVGDEVASLTTVSIDELDQSSARRHLWAANWQAFCVFPAFGSGTGSHAEVYPRFFPHPSTVEYTHAESGYVQLLSENGALGLVFLCLVATALVRWSIRGLRRAQSVEMGTCAMAIAAGILVSLVHSIWDFVWYLTGTMAFTVVIAACACRLAREQVIVPSRELTRQFSVGNWRWACATAIVVWGCMLTYGLGPALASLSWDEYKRLSLTAEETRDLAKSGEQQVAQSELDDQRYRQLQSMTAALKRTLARNPHHYRAHLRAASVLDKAFEIQQKYQPNAMAISQIRDAASASQFESREAYQAWLVRAIGPNIEMLRQARAHLFTAIKGLPMSGRAYARLANLAFIPPENGLSPDALLQQAQEVRPHDAEVLFELGRTAAANNELEKALGYWVRAYHQDEDYRQAITLSLATRLPVPFFIEKFQPNRPQLFELFKHYRRANHQQAAQLCAPRLAQLCSEDAQKTHGQQAGQLLVQAARLHEFAGDAAKMIEASSQAVEAHPNDVDTRLAFATDLLKVQRFEEAENEFKWCLRRRQNDPKAMRGLKTAQRLKLASLH